MKRYKLLQDFWTRNCGSEVLLPIGTIVEFDGNSISGVFEEIKEEPKEEPESQEEEDEVVEEITKQIEKEMPGLALESDLCWVCKKTATVESYRFHDRYFHRECIEPQQTVEKRSCSPADIPRP